ncbi:mortality factor 4-like protein 1 [Oscarella lobularis]|uniref:mortality factor 4-like protein 1 n=1 Tax=Oscarella lobularis TaxID=121494 RepID=UPI003313856D
MPPKPKGSDGDAKPKFSEGEKVLCFHGPLLYEAKCVKIQTTKDKCKYYVHYSGWSKNWDEWVPETRVLRYNEANLQKQRELRGHTGREMRDRKAKKRVDGSQQGQGKSLMAGERRRDGDGLRRKRPRLDPGVESEETFQNRVEVQVHIPDELKQVLIDDWDLIMRQKQLVKLPSSVPVAKILSNYLENSKEKTAKDSSGVLQEMTKGLIEYFNTLLGTQLLYKFERPQYAELLDQNPDLPVAQMYGGEYLLRLFVKLGSFLAYTTMDEESIRHLLEHIEDLLRYLQDNADDIFKKEYQVAPPDYFRKAIS